MKDRIVRHDGLWVVPDEPRPRWHIPGITKRDVAYAVVASLVGLALAYVILVAFLAAGA